jgi:hypothetical protein
MLFKVKKRKLYSLSILTAVFIATFALFSGFSYALDTRLNITMFESVTQNVTFAENFDLTENQQYCLINGILNVTNPSDEPIFDIYLELIQITKLASDISWVAGKEGDVVAGGAGVVHTISTSIGSNINNYTLITDLDNDGNMSDYLYTNGTALIFNLSSEGIIYVNLSNSTDPSISIENAGTVPVPIDMDGINITGSSRVLANITIIGTAQEDNVLDPADLTMFITEKPQSPVVIFIPELRPGNYTTFNYDISCIGTPPPLDISTSYTNYWHPNINKKVLTGFNWTINQSVGNYNELMTGISDINITMTAESVTWNTSLFSFGLEKLNKLGDYANVHGNGTLTTIWWWAPNGGTLAGGASKNISFIMSAPESVPASLTYKALTEEVTYRGDFLVSNMTLHAVNASADLEFNFVKRILKPSDNLNASHNVTWEIRPSLVSPINVSYNLNKVTLWVTATQDPADVTPFTKTYSGTPLMEVNLTSGSWNPSSDYWQFNYTDGSSPTYPPPIVWMKPEWIIKNAYGQIVNSSSTINGKDLYMKYIYVVNGYWLQIQKNITNIGEGEYSIYTYVENIGNGWTPHYEKVTVYDFVPNTFAADNWTVNPGSNLSVGVAGSDYYGTSYVWDIPWKGIMNSSLGPKNGPDATTWSNYSWNVSYTVTGSGTYKVSELYIVGLDPLKVDGAFASPIIAIISGIKTYTNEILYVSLVAFLIIVNVVNLFMTNRINSKLNQRLPPAPAPKPHHQMQQQQMYAGYNQAGQDNNNMNHQNQYNWK